MAIGLPKKAGLRSDSNWHICEVEARELGERSELSQQHVVEVLRRLAHALLPSLKGRSRRNRLSEDVNPPVKSSAWIDLFRQLEAAVKGLVGAAETLDGPLAQGALHR